MTEINESKVHVETSVITSRRQEGTYENASSLSKPSENNSERCVSSKGKKLARVCVKVAVLGKVSFAWKVEFCDDCHLYFASFAPQCAKTNTLLAGNTIVSPATHGVTCQGNACASHT